jgi:hypothetical protein
MMTFPSVPGSYAEISPKFGKLMVKARCGRIWWLGSHQGRGFSQDRDVNCDILATTAQDNAREASFALEVSGSFQLFVLG